MKKNIRLLHYINKKANTQGKKFNYSLLAEVFALIFLGISEHPMTPCRWIILLCVVITTTIAFIANE